ncbi:MAG: flagellar assembly protein FliH [Hyphomicrobiales bacterium]|nr:flagellar assembly protein FliH [Hyphomicrobiales bacterium]
MASPAKFLFDTDFGAPERDEEEERPVVDLADHEAALEAAEARGRAAGFEDGRSAVEAEAARAQAAAAERLANAAEALLSAVDTERRANERLALELAMTVARKLAPALIALEPLKEVEALIEECLGPLRQTPHLVIRIGEAHVEPLRELVDRLAYEKGFEGRLVILGEPEIADGDCRIEWADGGIVRDGEETAGRIEMVLERYLAARAIAGEAVPDHEQDEATDNAVGAFGDGA